MDPPRGRGGGGSWVRRRRRRKKYTFWRRRRRNFFQVLPKCQFSLPANEGHIFWPFFFGLKKMGFFVVPPNKGYLMLPYTMRRRREEKFFSLAPKAPRIFFPSHSGPKISGWVGPGRDPPPPGAGSEILGGWVPHGTPPPPGLKRWAGPVCWCAGD